MTNILTLSILFSFFTLSCANHEGQMAGSNEERTNVDLTDSNFQRAVNEIRNSDIYEKPENWELRGLNPSEESIILLLRSATNNFLENLEKIYFSNETPETKRQQVQKAVDGLPWDKLDTEEREFMADVLAPAILAAGFEPWDMF